MEFTTKTVRIKSNLFWKAILKAWIGVHVAKFGRHTRGTAMKGTRMTSCCCAKSQVSGVAHVIIALAIPAPTDSFLATTPKPPTPPGPPCYLDASGHVVRPPLPLPSPTDGAFCASTCYWEEKEEWGRGAACIPFSMRTRTTCLNGSWNVHQGWSRVQRLPCRLLVTQQHIM